MRNNAHRCVMWPESLVWSVTIFICIGLKTKKLDAMENDKTAKFAMRIGYVCPLY